MQKKPKEMLSDAEEYVLFGHPDTTMQDCDFLEDILKLAGCPSPTLLDIACGTGRHAVELAKRGYVVTGTDKSADMLRIARESSIAEGLDMTFDQRDMREMEYFHQFDLAYILFNTMGLLTGNDEILDFFNRVYAALQPDGLFIFQIGNIWSYIAEGDFSNSIYESEQDNGCIKRKLKMHMVIGPYNNVYRMHYDKRYWRNQIKMEPKSEDIDLRIFSLNELDLLMEWSGFQRLQVFGATDFAAVITNPNQIKKVEKPYHSYVVLAQKTENEVNHFGKSTYRTGRWRKRRNGSIQGYHRHHSRSGIPLSISQRSDSMGFRRIGWRRR